MSLILEALRKSEAQRRRAQAPDLFAELSPATRRAVASSPRWPGWALATVAALLLTSWLTRGLWNAPLQHAIAEPTPALSDVVPPEQSSSHAVVPAPTGVDASSPREPIATAPAPIAPAAGAAIAPPTPPARLPTLTTEPQPIAVAVRPANTASAPGNVTASAPLPAPMPPPPAVTALPATTNGAPLGLADLSSEQRRQLPELRMSMHLWNSVATERFVILDGQRMGEGDRIGAAVIEQITPDGVMLGWQGRRLKLPMR